MPTPCLIRLCYICIGSMLFGGAWHWQLGSSWYGDPTSAIFGEGGAAQYGRCIIAHGLCVIVGSVRATVAECHSTCSIVQPC